ncbi:hypothetical protein [Actinoplanes sp. G11-F43]|uniref:hypothetical protein n=1 Tax=Actinoplanes sp. G11-F43 TaxID=3424130 RepID=UPI003D340284
MDENPSRTKPLLPVLGLVGAVLVASVVGFWPDGDKPATAIPVAAPSASLPPLLPPTAEPVPVTPFSQVADLLDDQVQALVKGDEAGWLAPVDKKLHPRYRTIFKNLRALDLTAADMVIHGEVKTKGGTLTSRVGLAYCFSGNDCPAYGLEPGSGSPKMISNLTWSARNGSWTITKANDSGIDNYMQPAPWEKADLTVARSARVIVAGPKSQARNVKRVLRLADKAAVVADRFAGRLNNPQKVYRIYVADNKVWKSWYDGRRPAWAVAYHRQHDGIGSDIILKASQVLSGNDRYATEIIQHEMAHAVTLGGTRNRDDEDDMWLIEGIAEYIGYLPAKPRATYSRDALRYVHSRRGPIKTIALPSLGGKPDDVLVTRLYATGHFAVGCMAAKYGETKMLDFVDMVLHEGMEPDVAAPIAFRKPFKTVDKACVSWIKRQL